jgi:hypothetical protein
MSEIDIIPHMVTVFRDIKSTDTPFYRDVRVILDRIKDGQSKDLIKTIRITKDKSERQEIKKELPSICFSGTFTKRADAAIDEHSGLICLDFDGYPKKKDMLEAKERLSKSEYVFAVFISPSGNGLKVVVRIPADPESHKQYFNGLKKHFDSPYFDVTSKNVSRACYESYDPHVYINENSTTFTEVEEEEFVAYTKHQDPPSIIITDENKIVEILQKWWVKKYPMVEGSRNDNVYILAAALNDHGVSKSLATYILAQYEGAGFGSEEIRRTIDSAYSHTEKFGSRFYEDKDKMDGLMSKVKRGASKQEMRSQLEEDGLEGAEADQILARVYEEAESQTFWQKMKNGSVRIIHLAFKQFLETNGFYKFCPEGGKNHVFVRVVNNLIDHTSDKEIKDFILDYLLDVGDSDVYNYFAEMTKYFKEDFLSLLGTIDVYFIADNKDTAYLYYRNCAVKVERGGIDVIDYMDLGGYVWKDHVIDRNFMRCKDDKCDYKTFVRNICSKDSDRVGAMESTIGFMLHGYKNLSFCPAIILNDEVITDTPEGGTGKGIFINALSQMKKLVVIDGKSFTFERSFAYQLVSADTQILCFDDVRKHFDFERLFSAVTEGLTLEKKNKDAIKIPFSKSPKVAITTNYAIKGAGNSFERRKWELELHQHYGQAHTPLDEFGKLMFGDWSEDEWCQFDNYMINNLRGYLKTGLVKSSFVNLSIRKLSAETSHEFIEWCGLTQGSVESSSLVLNHKTYKQPLYQEFIDEYPDYGQRGRMALSRTKFYKWLVAYGKHKYKAAPLEGRDLQGRWIEFINKHKNEVQTEAEI